MTCTVFYFLNVQPRNTRQDQSVKPYEDQISNHAKFPGPIQKGLPPTTFLSQPSLILPPSLIRKHLSTQPAFGIFQLLHLPQHTLKPKQLSSTQLINMPPKAADKKPAASKAPATAQKAPEKKDAGKKTAATGDKKKRTKARKETYSSYIYKGKFKFQPLHLRVISDHLFGH